MIWLFSKNKEEDLLKLVESKITQRDKRDVCYSALIMDIAKSNRQNQRLKNIFFYLVCAVFAYTCYAGMNIIVNISEKPDTSIADIVALLSALGSVITAIMILPKTIANHLFPENSEQPRFDFVKMNRDYDEHTKGEDASTGAE